MTATDLRSQVMQELADGLLILDQRGIIVDANPAICLMLGYTSTELTGRALSTLASSPDGLAGEQLIGQFEQNQRIPLKLVKQDGATITTELSGRLFTHHGQSFVLVSIRDNTEQVATIENLYRKEQERRQIAQGLRDMLDKLNSSLELSEVLDYLMSEAERLLKADAVAVFELKKDQTELTVAAARGLSGAYVARMDVPLGGGAVGQAAVIGEPVYVPDVLAILPTYQPDQHPERRDLLVALAKDYPSVLAVPLFIRDAVYGGLVLYYPAPRQLTSDQIALATAFGDQVALAIENARLRDNAQQAATLAERQRLARELHDAVTQTLFSANLIAEILPDLQAVDPDEFLERVVDLRRLIRGALAEMRTLLLELRPVALVETPLRDLIRQLVEATTARTRLKVDLELCEESHILPPDAQATLYRIAQEALHNVVRHARAETLMVALSCQPAYAELVVVDDGQGFDLQQISGEHFGLHIMRERASSIGADLCIESQPTQGTRVAVVWSEAEENPAND
ncbi:MAG: GAF domain-containing protein [Chloroflexi bacterium]|nr:GAF domain-containing protein [Chloroflexota bacterium]